MKPPVRRQKFAEIIAQKIENDIIATGWPVGELIGSEGDLMARMGVSRAVMREAIRIVENHNVARMRRGPGGGLIVKEPDPDSVQHAVALYLTFAGVRPEQLFETRTALEIVSVGHAAERINENGVGRLREVIAMEELLQEEALGSGHHHDLHVLIAELSGNPAMTLFIHVLTALTPQRQRLNPKQDVSDYHSVHEGLVEAIVAGDVGLAQHRMRRHLAAVALLVGEKPYVTEMD